MCGPCKAGLRALCMVQVKIEEAEDGSTCDVKALGSKEELERFCEALKLSETGKIRVPGLMENFAALSDE